MRDTQEPEDQVQSATGWQHHQEVRHKVHQVQGEEEERCAAGNPSNTCQVRSNSGSTTMDMSHPANQAPIHDHQPWQRLQPTQRRDRATAKQFL